MSASPAVSESNSMSKLHEVQAYMIRNLREQVRVLRQASDAQAQEYVEITRHLLSSNILRTVQQMTLAALTRDLLRAETEKVDLLHMISQLQQQLLVRQKTVEGGDEKVQE